MFSSRRVVVLFACIPHLLISALAPSASAEVSYRSVAVTGTQASDTDLDTEYIFFLWNPVINDYGKVAFHAFLTGPNVSAANNNGIWLSSSDHTSLAVRAGDQAIPLNSDVVFSGVGAPNINSSGDIAFIGSLNGSGVSPSNDSGIWVQDSSATRLVAREGGLIPGTTSSEVFTSFSSLVFNNDAKTAFIADSQVPGDLSTSRQGIWSEGSDALKAVAVQGQLPPGVVNGVEYTSLSGLVMNDQGQTAFHSQLLYPPALDNYGQGVWSEGTGSLSLVALRGEVADIHEPGNVILGLSQPVINNAGDTAFAVVIDRPQLSDSGILLYDGDAVDTIVQSGDYVQDSEYGIKFGQILAELQYSNVVINASGQTAFFATTAYSRHGSLTGIWREDHGVIKSIASVSDDAPGASYREKFGFHFGPSSDYYPVINASGQVAFMAQALDPDRPDQARDGLWATNTDDELELIALVGELFDVNDDPLIEDWRIISSVDFANGSGGEDGLPNSFNDAGQLVFKLGFSDGSSGIFVATVPEPATACILAISAVNLLRPRR